MLLAATGLLLRLGSLAATFPGNDRVVYWEDAKIGRNLQAGHGYSLDHAMRKHLFYDLFMQAPLPDPHPDSLNATAVKTPIYPCLIAGVFWIFGDRNFLALFLLQALLSTASCLILMRALQGLDPTAASLAGLGAAVYPPFIAHCVSKPESTTLLLFELTLFLYLLGGSAALQRASRAIVLGVVAGVLALTEPLTLPITMATLLLVFIGRGELPTWNRRVLHGSMPNGGAASRPIAFIAGGDAARPDPGTARPVPAAGHAAARLLLLAAAGMILVLAPWVGRNLRVFAASRPLKTGVGMNLLRGLEQSGGWHVLSDARLAELERAGRSLDEAQEDEALRRAVMETARHDPGRWVRSMLRNVVSFWWEPPNLAGAHGITFLVGRRIPYVFLLVLGLPSLASSLSRSLRGGSHPILTALLLLVLTYTVVYGIFGAWNLRFHLPVELALIALAALGVGRLVAGRANAGPSRLTRP